MLVQQFTSNENIIEVYIHDIKILFDDYKDPYIETFNLDQNNFLVMKNLKIARGGCLIMIKINSVASGFFTISRHNNTIGEFGDLFKSSTLLSREDFAKAMTIGLNAALTKLSLKGFYSYQNHNAIKLISKAGFNRKTFYERHLSLVIFNIIIKLPLRIIDRKIYFTISPLLQHLPIRFSLKLARTRLSKFFLQYVRNLQDIEAPKRTFILIGILNEFFDVTYPADSLMFFGDLETYNLKTGFEYSDNSA